MATVAENLQTILDIKSDIKTAIINKGVSVADTDSFTTYADKIESIETGGELGSITITENGTYTPSEGVDGYNEVNVNVTTPIESYILPEGIKFSESSFSEIPTNFDYRNITDMSKMFQNCKNIITVPSFLNCQNVTNMSYMFYGATFVGTLGGKINLFDTSNVTDMSYMFYNCTSIPNVPQLDTSNVSDMSYMFYGCSKLTTIPLLNTSNVTNMNSMFANCSLLTTIPQLDTSSTTNVGYMFNNCRKLETLPLMDFGQVTEIFGFFTNGTDNNLTNLGGFKNLKISWTDAYGLYRAEKLTYESVMNVINNLYDFRGNGDTSTTRTIKFSDKSKALLSDEDIAVATNKGWTIS